jgi:hypothetical protein
MSATDPRRAGVRAEDRLDLLTAYAGVPIRSFTETVNAELLRRTAAAAADDEGIDPLKPKDAPEGPPPKDEQQDQVNKIATDDAANSATKMAEDMVDPEKKATWDKLNQDASVTSTLPHDGGASDVVM